MRIEPCKARSHTSVDIAFTPAEVELIASKELVVMDRGGVVSFRHPTLGDKKTMRIGKNNRGTCILKDVDNMIGDYHISKEGDYFVIARKEVQF